MLYIISLSFIICWQNTFVIEILMALKYYDLLYRVDKINYMYIAQ